LNQARRRVGPVLAGVVLLALATAGIHLYLFIIEGFLGNGQMLPIYQLLFVGNFLAYVTLSAVLYLPAAALERVPLERLRLPAWVLLISVATASVATASVASYIHVGVFDFLGHLDKVIDVLLAALLAADANMAGRASGAALFLRPVMV
jgi:hypothetical protein